MRKRVGILSGLALMAWSSSWPVHAQTPPSNKIPAGYVVKNMEVVGHLLTDPPPFKMSIQQVDGRWYLYTGLLMSKEGWEVIDVTDPAAPKLVKVIDGPKNSMTFNMEIHDGKMVTALQRRMPGPPYFGDPKKPADVGFYVWDVRDPVNPKRLSHYNGGNVHRLGYFGGPYVHLPIVVDGYKGFIYQIVDWEKNVEVGRWWVPGQKQGEPQEGESDPSKEREFRGISSLHGPPYVVGNLAYLSYGSAGMIILDISDVTQPKMVGRLDFSPPFNDAITVHTVQPLPGRGLAIVMSEARSDRCADPLNFAGLVDIKDPAKPRLVSLFPVPEPPPGSPYKDFCEKPGRFGPHNLNEHAHNEFVENDENRAYVAYFNAGLRVFDTSNAHLPKEIAYFIPPNPTRIWGARSEDTWASSTDDVLVDTRGFIYVTHTNQGLWILRLSGG